MVVVVVDCCVWVCLFGLLCWLCGCGAMRVLCCSFVVAVCDLFCGAAVVFCMG